MYHHTSYMTQEREKNIYSHIIDGKNVMIINPFSDLKLLQDTIFSHINTTREFVRHLLPKELT